MTRPPHLLPNTLRPVQPQAAAAPAQAGPVPAGGARELGGQGNPKEDAPLRRALPPSSSSSNDPCALTGVRGVCISGCSHYCCALPPQCCVACEPGCKIRWRSDATVLWSCRACCTCLLLNSKKATQSYPYRCIQGCLHFLLPCAQVRPCLCLTRRSSTGAQQTPCTSHGKPGHASLTSIPDCCQRPACRPLGPGAARQASKDRAEAAPGRSARAARTAPDATPALAAWAAVGPAAPGSAKARRTAGACRLRLQQRGTTRSSSGCAAGCKYPGQPTPR